MMLHLDLRCRVGGFELAVRELVETGGCTGIFGRSGSGKTTLLRAVAGFQAADGSIRLGEELWLDSIKGVNWPPHRRRAGYVFQRGALFSHLDVRGNLDYPVRRLKSRHNSSEDWPGRPGFDRVVEALDLGSLLHRHVNGLSGGETQRVALGRALLSDPALMLLDEPLSALDLGRKVDILPFLARIKSEFRVPMLYVSHSVDELVRVADHLLVLADGEVLAHGETGAVLERLDVQSVTGRFEGGSVVTAQVERHDPTRFLTLMGFAGTRISMPMLDRLEPGTAVRLRIRSRDVAIATEQPRGISIRNVVPAEVLEVDLEAGSPYAEVLLNAGNQHLRARITRDAVADLQLVPGGEVFALIKSVTFDHRAL
ncbi:MAG: molybdenum ABC transporter ATP-binding protein [Gammaproteobacteria bacterium]|nr:molybdenum ABC transporter ATP-binding protein [Gammaproteobacteria bacterium]